MSNGWVLSMEIGGAEIDPRHAEANTCEDLAAAGKIDEAVLLHDSGCGWWDARVLTPLIATANVKAFKRLLMHDPSAFSNEHEIRCLFEKALHYGCVPILDILFEFGKTVSYKWTDVVAGAGGCRSYIWHVRGRQWIMENVPSIVFTEKRWKFVCGEAEEYL